ncbi:molybdenum cofactor guanylyltransferase [Paraglaciecola sp. 20A4]|uniref:molybdenum cofactor guanylyltransferase n=1 Tax=Paraglaciecola sp. 20A4 TaxID=2687288 RepID=UPI00140C0098|nr:molybdenum cofactor guanylyltransferase [Paraglaciecola sp. 20A4]
MVVVSASNTDYSTSVSLRNPHVVGLVLAGGLSLRMGQDKSKLRLNRTGKSMLEHAKQLLRHSGLSCVLVSGSEVDQIPDIYPNSGPLAGIHSAFIFAQNNHPQAKSLIVIPVDMPNLRADTLGILLNAASGSNTIVHFKDLNLPLCIPLKNSIFDYLTSTLEDTSSLSLYNLLSTFSAKSIPVPYGISHREFDNVNYPAQWTELNR